MAKSFTTVHMGHRVRAEAALQGDGSYLATVAVAPCRDDGASDYEVIIDVLLPNRFPDAGQAIQRALECGMQWVDRHV